MSTTKPSVAALASGGTYPAGDASAMTGLPPDFTFDVGQLYLAAARLDTPTTPNAGGTQVADEFDDATGVGSLGSGVVGSGYLGNAGSQSQVAQATGTAIGDVTMGGGVAACFDGNATQIQSAGGYNNAGGVGWIGKDWGAGNDKIITGFKIWGSSNAGFSGTMDGRTVTLALYGNSTNNTATATLLGSTTAANTASVLAQVMSGLTTTTAYRYHWIKLTYTDSSSCVAELQFFTTAAPLNITTVSNAYTALTAPATVSFVVEYQDISTTAVLNTDITLEASRNGGTTWTAATLSDFGPSPISGARVLRGSATVSGQPSGTSVKWRVKTFNTKEQRVHGLWMQWK